MNKEYMRQWRLKNKEKIKEYITKYKQENREHVLAVQRILNHKNSLKRPKVPKVPKESPKEPPKEKVPSPKSSKVLENVGVVIEKGLFKISF